MRTRKEREIVLDLLLQTEKEEKQGGAFAGALLKSVLAAQDDLPQEKKAFIRHLAAGVTERRITLDYAIDLFAKTKTAAQKPVIRALLRMGAYQILFMGGVPDAAAVNETVKLAEKRGFRQLKGFVNGVLRTLSAEKENIDYPTLSVRYSVPSWICDMWTQAFGAERTGRILEAFSGERALTLHIDERLDGEQEAALRRKLAAAAHPLHPAFVSLFRAGDPAKLPGYREGLFFIQDAAAGLAVSCAGLKAGDTVVDVCAAPGGKTIHAAMLLQKLTERGAGADGQNKADAAYGTVRGKEGGAPYLVIARDKSEEKCARIRENAVRMRLNGVRVEAFDATVRDASLVGRADVLLCDVPCSGLGVIGRKHEICYRVTQEDIASLAALQKKILTACADYVKPGGVLVFSTCTLTAAENEETAEWIVRTLPFEAAPFSDGALMGGDGTALFSGEEDVLSSCGVAGMPHVLRVLPDICGTDGFFIARFRRK